MIEIDVHKNDKRGVDKIEDQMATGDTNGHGIKANEVEINMNKGGGMLIAQLLTNLLMKYLQPEQVKAEVEKLTARLPEEKKREVLGKIDTILALQVVGTEHQMAGDPMLTGQDQELNSMMEGQQGSRMQQQAMDQQMAASNGSMDFAGIPENPESVPMGRTGRRDINV